MTIRDIREIISFAIMDGQNQIHDLKDGRATPEEVNERMFKSLDYFTTQAEQAINAYILGEVMELIGADVNQLWVEDDSFCMKCDFELVDGTRNCKCVSHNLLRQELRNKANERWGSNE
jgi:hypothetical protein